MIKKLLFLLCFISFSYGQVQSPEQFLGYPLGSQFTRHHRVVEYFKYLAAEASGQVALEKYGETNEGRELYLVFIGTPEHIENREQLRQKHISSLNQKGTSDLALVWLSYNVHGNESVSTEASMQTAFELLTSRRDYLKNTLVIIDPCINPDGRDRYVNWYNQTKNSLVQVDPNSAEHFEPWHSGRTNHYVFDLNRDWVWMTQAESKARLPQYQKWMPHIHVDFHEQGVNEPYYFAPAAEPLHERITEFQRSFQVAIGKNHAKYFDKEGWLYFTKERFDLLYPSYGDTYPTYNGAIGMTYEQGGSGRAGLGILTNEGDTLTLKDRIAHHHTTGLSTVEMASNHSKKLQTELSEYTKKGFEDSSTYVVYGENDHINALKQLLDNHEITYGYGKGSLVNGYHYRSKTQKRIKADENTLIVPTGQLRNNLIHVLFEPETRLTDSITYDITAWSLPFAYDLDAIKSDKQVPYNLTKTESEIQFEKGAYAYVLEYSGFQSQRVLARLLNMGMTIRTNYESFTLEGNTYPAGSSILLTKENTNLEMTLESLQTEHGVIFTAVQTGFVDSGKDFGSPSVKKTKAAKIALLKGNGISSYSFGEWWYFLEQDLSYPLSVLETEYLGYIDLSDYDVLVMPDGNYRNFSENTLSKIEKWVSDGGRLIAQMGALRALERQGSFGIQTRKSSQDNRDPLLPYGSAERESIKNYITGAIFKAHIDTTHPIAFGYSTDYYGLKLSEEAYELLDSGNLAYFEKGVKPIAGFAGQNTLQDLGESLFIGAESHGRGSVVYFTDNPVFRGFWYGGKRLVVNALFFDF